MPLNMRDGCTCLRYEMGVKMRVLMGLRRAWVPKRLTDHQATTRRKPRGKQYCIVGYR
jgi:hypothetical protein